MSTWVRTDAGYALVPDHGGRAVQREPDDPHRLEVGRPGITPGDLELARQGIPSRTVSHVAMAEAQELMAQLAATGCIQSPEARAMYDAQEALARREAVAEREAQQAAGPAAGWEAEAGQ